MTAVSTTSPKPFSLMSIAIFDWKAKLKRETAQKMKHAYIKAGVSSFLTPEDRCLRSIRRSSNWPFGSCVAVMIRTGITPT